MICRCFDEPQKYAALLSKRCADFLSNESLRILLNALKTGGSFLSDLAEVSSRFDGAFLPFLRNSFLLNRHMCCFRLTKREIPKARAKSSGLLLSNTQGEMEDRHHG